MPLHFSNGDIRKPRPRDLAAAEPELFMIPWPRNEGVGNAGCSLHPQLRVQSSECKSTLTTGTPDSPGAPTRDGLRLISYSPRRSGFLVTVASEYGFVEPGWADIASADLTPASRRQDHTSSPSATAPFVFRAGHRSRQAALRSLCALDAIRGHHIPLRVRDDRDTPLCGAGWRRYAGDLGRKRRGIFLREGTGQVESR
jgi:hypothetical protein